MDGSTNLGSIPRHPFTKTIKKRGDNINKIDNQRSIKIIERKLDTVLGTITYKVQIENDLFKYKSKEEIANMVEKVLQQDYIRCTLNNVQLQNKRSK